MEMLKASFPLVSYQITSLNMQTVCQ